MNSIKTSPRGFPFDELTLKELQEQTQPFLAALGSLVPDNSRVSGVEHYIKTTGFSFVPYYTDGFIRWNGELLPFKGGTADSEFSILEEIQDRTFNVGTEADPLLEDHPAYVRRWAQIGNIEGAESVHLISNLQRVPRFLPYLHQGTLYIGTTVPTLATFSKKIGTVITVQFTDIGTSNYMVLSNFFRTGTTSQGEFDFEIIERTATGFKLLLKNITEPVKHMMYQYLIIPSANFLNVVGAQNP